MPLILLAEDESSTIDLVRSALSSQGWLVKTVSDRDQALRAASEFAPQLVLVADRLTGARDLVRTFSRRSGGPGVVLLTSDDDAEAESAAVSPDVDAILAKPLETDALIETIRQGLVDGRGKPSAPPVVDTEKVLSSQDIFGDLLDDILDPEAVTEAEPEASAAEPEPEPVRPEESVLDIAKQAEIEDASEPTIDEAPTAAAAKDADQAVGIPVSGLEDLEEVVREGVEAWADSLHPDEAEPPGTDPLTELAEATRAPAEPEPESEEDLESKLEDTLAGVLAASLSQVDDKETAAEPPAKESLSVDDLLSAALGDLHLDTSATSPAVEGPAGPTIDDELEALAASIEIEPIAEPPTLAGDREEPEPADTESGFSEDIASKEDVISEVTDQPEQEAVEAAAEPVEERLEPLAEAAVPPPAAPGVEFGEYTLEKQIGVGGMASVWKARRKGVEGFEKRVAIKKILPQAAENEDFVEMFINEAKLAAQLNHANITHIYDLGKIDDDYFIAMEHVEGRNLRQILNKTRKKQQSVPVGVALFVALQIADALDYAHRSKDFDDAELGLVHRDVSPQNVLISFEGDIKLCDFGIAKAVSKISTTQMGALKGKLQYMSPEQAWGRAIDHRSDIFSLGVLLYEMLTGERLFTGESEMAVLEAVREADVGTQIIQSPDIPAGVKGLLLRSLAREPEDRFESAADLHRGLEELLKDESPAPGPKSLAAFVREILELQPEPLESSEPPVDEQPEPQLEIPEDLEAPPESTDTEEEDETTTPWLRRILTRLLPVLLVIGVGGGILAGLMQKQAPVTPSRSESSTPVTSLATTDSASASTGEATAVDPQGQPPPAPIAADPTPAPPAKPQTQKPATETPPAKDPPATTVGSQERAAEPSQEASQEAADPELERQVKEDLERVQELMAAPKDSPQSAPSGRTTAPQTNEEPMTLGSMWSDVSATDETGVAGAGVPSGEPVQPGPGVVEPRLLEFVPPEYTEAARQAGVEGTIRISVLVGENGRALEVRLIQGLDSQVGLEDACVEAAQKAVFQPASEDGTPVKMWYQVAVPYQP